MHNLPVDYATACHNRVTPDPCRLERIAPHHAFPKAPKACQTFFVSVKKWELRLHCAHAEIMRNMQPSDEIVERRVLCVHNELGAALQRGGFTSVLFHSC